MEELNPNRAQLFVRNKYTVFTMGGTVALRSVNKIFPESYSSAASSICSVYRVLIRQIYVKGNLVANERISAFNVNFCFFSTNCIV